MKNEIIFVKREDSTQHDTMSGGYYERSQPTYNAYRKMLDDFNEKYPGLCQVADTLLYPDSTFQPVFDGLETKPGHTRNECPGAPERKRRRKN
jgi:hypothetical protein